jgi:hypothetical protein
LRTHRKNRGWDKFHGNPEKASKIRKEETLKEKPSYESTS